MFRQVLRESRPSAQLLFSALILIISGLVITALGMAIGKVIYGFSFSEIEKIMQDLSNPENISILKFFQTVQSIGVFIVPPFIIAIMLDGHPSTYLKYNKLPGVQSIILVVAIVFFSNPLINWLNEINSKLTLPDWLNSVQVWMQNSEDQANKITEAFLSTTSLTALLKNLVMIAILPALGEELLFRGIVQQLLKKMYGNPHIAIWISAALFSALHLQFFGFLPRLVLGAMFGYM
ncbi:MAG: CPBP family intramembrane glutamic endopeptidase, partial [Bacteroidota bacterium]